MEIFRSITSKPSLAQVHSDGADGMIRAIREQQAFLLQLRDTLARIADPREMQRQAAHLLGEYLPANRVRFDAVVADVAFVEEGYSDGLPPMVSQLCCDDCTERLIETYRAGRTAVCGDVMADPAISDAEASVIVASGFSAYIGVPLIRNGVWTATLSVHCIQPRTWTANEVAIVEQTAERAWAAIEAARARVVLREATERQAFMSELDHALRPLTDPLDIQALAVQLLGDHLTATRTFYGEVESDGKTIVVNSDHASGLPSIAGRFPLATFAHIRDACDLRRTLAIADAPVEWSRDPAAAGAFICVPIIKNDRVVAALGVQHAVPREWTQAEIALADETAERIWACVERASAAAAALREHDELERRLQQLTSDLSRMKTSLRSEVSERQAVEHQIRALFERVVSIQEEERRRIARDIHDQLGQQMTALRMSLEAATAWVDGDASRAKHAGRMQQLAEELDRSIDFLTWGLRPPAVDDLGLSAALHNLVSGWSERFGVVAEFNAGGMSHLRLSPDAETNLYRIVQEALHNIIKHARATQVSVLLQRRDEQVWLVIEDDGLGFDLTQAHQHPGTGGLGLVSMRERAVILEGELEIETSPGNGTTIFVRIPLSRHANEAGDFVKGSH
jgi:signal transduction histidine kinase